MHPVIQLTVAVAMVVIATRIWHPLLFWLAGLFFLIGLIKMVRRCARWLKNKSERELFGLTFQAGIYSAMWLAVAYIADYLFPNKISAVSILLCFICAFLIIGLLLFFVGVSRRYLHRR